LALARITQAFVKNKSVSEVFMKKSSWIIAGLVVALGLIYWFIKEDHISVGVKKLSLPTFSADKVDRIEINTKEKVVLVKDGDKWMLDLGTPENTKLVKADRAHVTAMLDAALAIKHSHYVTNLKEKYKELGLEGDSSVLVTIYSGGAPVWSLVLGNNDAGSGKYAKISDDEGVYVVRGSFWALTRNGRLDWRDREVISVKENELKSFTINKPGGNELALTKEGDVWTIDRSKTKVPEGFREDKNAISALVRTALSLQAHGFVDEPKELFSPIVSMNAITADATQKLEIFPGGETVYWARRVGEAQIYEIVKFAFDKLNKPLDELRDLAILNFDKTSIVKLSLKAGKDHIVIAKKDNHWTLEEPGKLPADFEFDPNTVDDMVSMVSGLHGERIANKSKDVGQNQQWQKDWLIELVSDKGDKVHLFAEKSKANKDEYVAQGNIDKEIYVVKAARLASLTHGLKAFKKEEFELPPVDENTRGFESLPVDVQRKLLDATKKKHGAP
jgi:hypothetical protein